MKAKIWTRMIWIPETDPDRLRAFLSAILGLSGFTIVGFTDYHFDPVGYTAVWIIAESHLAVHTFPEERKTFVEIASCNQEKFQAFLKAFIAEFGYA